MPGPDDSSPLLLTQALPGVRAFGLDADGRLLPATGGTPWEPGINVARCGRGLGHLAPDPGCMCGLYAFHALHRQLRDSAVLAAIAAWGEMEVHRDGFRARFARVLALADVSRRQPAMRAAVRRAAERYGVPIVPRLALAPVGALQTGQLPPSLVDVSNQALPQWLAGRRGYDAVSHLWVEASAGHVTVGVGEGLRQWLGTGVHVAGLRTGGALGHEPLRIVGRRREVTVVNGVAGRVEVLNPEVVADATDGEGAGWLFRVTPHDWLRDCLAFDWGPAGYLALRGAASGSQPFAHLATAQTEPIVRSWRDVADLLRSERPEPAPAFGDARALYDGLGIALGAALQRDEGGRRHLEALEAVISFRTRAPQAVVEFDFRHRPARLRLGTHGGDADVVVQVAADDLVALLGGRLDLARESRTGRLDVLGERGAALSSLAALVAWARPHVAAA